MAHMDSVLFVGLGRMGYPMAYHLASKGAMVFGYDIDNSKIQQLVENGGYAVNNLEQSMTDVGAVCIMVRTEYEVRQIVEKCTKYLYKDGIIIVSSTVSPSVMEELAIKIESSGLHLVESPVCRSELGAIQGNLLSLVVAKDEIFTRALPILRSWSGDIIHINKDSWGTAQISKNLNDFILWAEIMAIEEALGLGSTFNISKDKLLKVLNNGSADSWAVRNWDNVGKMVWSKKDMEITVGLLQEQNLNLPLIKQIRNMVHTSNILNHA